MLLGYWLMRSHPRRIASSAHVLSISTFQVRDPYPCLYPHRPLALPLPLPFLPRLTLPLPLPLPVPQHVPLTLILALTAVTPTPTLALNRVG